MSLSLSHVIFEITCTYFVTWLLLSFYLATVKHSVKHAHHKRIKQRLMWDQLLISINREYKLINRSYWIFFRIHLSKCDDKRPTTPSGGRFFRRKNSVLIRIMIMKRILGLLKLICKFVRPSTSSLITNRKTYNRAEKPKLGR